MENLKFKKFKLNKKEWYRFEELCKKVGLEVETRATYTYANLCETENCYLRVFSKDKLIAIADLLED